MKRYRLPWLLLALGIAFMTLAMWLKSSALVSGTVSGIVVSEEGPLARARVRVRATDNLTFTDASGHFILSGLTPGEPIEASAWYTGYYISSAHVTPTVAGVTLTLRPYHLTDNPEYTWTSPISGSVAGACGDCHPMIMPQWSGNAHGGSVSNPRFYSLYDGTNISGTHTVSPGYRLDFPGTAGNCASCHAPGAAVDGYMTTVMSVVRDDITAGIHCDFCHKVGGVYLNPATGSVYPNTPGVQGQQVLRPPEGDNIFFGPFDDIPDPDTYLPLISESAFCAPCHQFSFWGTPIYESFEEWLASPYAEQGKTCQACHMPPNGDVYFASPEVGGLEHPPEQIPSHLQPGALDEELLQNTVSLTVSSGQFLNRLLVTVVITNSGAGHHAPTDHPGRQIILTVAVTDEQGDDLALLGGPVVPGWGGDQAGSPGQAFAKILADIASGESPVVSYWRPSVVVEDNRLPALGSIGSVYSFLLPKDVGEVQVQTRLVFRRLFQELAEQKGWQTPDILMEMDEFTLSPHPVHAVYLPKVGSS